MKAWHSMTAREAVKALKSDERWGLSGKEAALRLERQGRNQLARGQKRSLPGRLWEQLKDPMILVLLGAALLSLWASNWQDWLDGAIILLIVVVNACISIFQESNAEKALEALQKLSAPMARVVREGEILRIEAALLVPGDILLLEAGDLVSADARLLSAAGLRVDESAMTGESAPVEKAPGILVGAEAPVGDRGNMVLSSTVVTAGRGRAVVTATGMDTEMGRIAGLLLGEKGRQTPLQKKMGEISGTLSFLCLCICALMFGVGALRHKDLLDMFMTAVALAVAAIPEGLVAIVTIVLALGVGRLAGRGAIVKKLPAVETLGCAGVICSDKTGTLTENRMTVTQVWTPRGGSEQLALTIGALCNDAVRTAAGDWAGDPTETALAEAARQAGLDKAQLERELPRQLEVPFDSGRKLMTTVHRLKSGGFRVCVKGAPDVLLERCPGLTAAQRREIAEKNEALADRALRVLGTAYKDMARAPEEGEEAQLERGLTFAGLLGMMDPPRREVKEAVARCRRAGIRPVMITGDHRHTAVAVAREVDIFRPGELAVTGADLDFMPQELLEREVERFSVYARVSPAHKMRIVKAWQSRGKIVAMTGDGVNDAPALKAADIGCAMGKGGTDVAKEASDLVLTDDNFATIVSAVEQGRGIYANIRKAIHYLLSCNIGEILTLFVSTLLGFPRMPLLPVQLLWLNLVTDSLPALALGVEKVEEGTMERPPREAGESLFSHGFGRRLVLQGCLVGLLALGAWGLGELVFLDGEVANTMAFATLTFTQLFHAFDVRSEEESLFRLGIFSNRVMNRAFLVGGAMSLAVLCLPPLQTVFSTVDLDLLQWGSVLGLSVTPVVVCELGKTLRRRRRRVPDGRGSLPAGQGRAKGREQTA